MPLRTRSLALGEVCADLDLLAGLIEEERTLREGGITKPLTPAQTVKRGERDQARREQIQRVSASAAKRIADLRSQLGR